MYYIVVLGYRLGVQATNVAGSMCRSILMAYGLRIKMDDMKRKGNEYGSAYRYIDTIFFSKESK